MRHMSDLNYNPGPLLLERRRQKLTQQAVADKLGKHRYSIIRVEAGEKKEVSESLVRDYAALLGVDPELVFTSS
jgi:transcriptional regulator with XRE-family HTH domain